MELYRVAYWAAGCWDRAGSDVVGVGTFLVCFVLVLAVLVLEFCALCFACIIGRPVGGSFAKTVLPLADSFLNTISRFTILVEVFVGGQESSQTLGRRFQLD